MLNFMCILLDSQQPFLQRIVDVAGCLAQSESGNFAKAVDCRCLDYYHAPSELRNNLEIVHAPSKYAINKANTQNITYQRVQLSGSWGLSCCSRSQTGCGVLKASSTANVA